MDVIGLLRPHIDGKVSIKGKEFTLESVEEDHLVLRDEDSMHTMVWYTSIQSVREGESTTPEIILLARIDAELD
jgi:hypothetical protein